MSGDGPFDKHYRAVSWEVPIDNIDFAPGLANALRIVADWLDANPDVNVRDMTLDWADEFFLWCPTLLIEER